MDARQQACAGGKQTGDAPSQSTESTPNTAISTCGRPVYALSSARSRPSLCTVNVILGIRAGVYVQGNDDDEGHDGEGEWEQVGGVCARP